MSTDAYAIANLVAKAKAENGTDAARETARAAASKWAEHNLERVKTEMRDYILHPNTPADQRTRAHIDDFFKDEIAVIVFTSQRDAHQRDSRERRTVQEGRDG